MNLEFKPFISVIICTFNRCTYLEALLQSLCNQEYPAEHMEVLVIDNASTDGTAAEIERLQHLTGYQFRYLAENRPGVSYARNTGIDYAAGEIVAFIDDDAVASPVWLSKLAEGFQKYPDAICISGGIDLHWEAIKPAWLLRELQGFLGDNLFLGDESRWLQESESVFEGNLAVRRATIQQVGGFDPQFGPRGKQMVMLEGYRLAKLLREHGQIRYCPAARVHHRVPQDRTTRSYLINRGYLQGKSNARLRYIENLPTRWRIMRDILADLYFLAGDLLGIVKLLPKGPGPLFTRTVFTFSRLGQILQNTRYLFGLK